MARRRSHWQDDLAAYPIEGRLGGLRAPKPAPFYPELARKLELSAELRGHEGCVNRLCWNQDGRLLASASDDLRVLIWHASDPARAPLALETRHASNLFGVQFMPESGDARVVSGGMDCTVQLHELDAPPAAAAPVWQRGGGGGASGGGMRRHGGGVGVPEVVTVRPRTTVFDCHEGRVKDVKTVVGEPALFWSASEDGTVRQYDLRAPGSRTPRAANVLIRAGGGDGSGGDGSGGAVGGMGAGIGGGGGLGGLNAPRRRVVELKGLDVCAARPHLMAVACGDPFVRIYDRRKLAPGAAARADAGAAGELLALAPPHMPIALYDRRATRAHATFVAFSARGDKVIAPYHGSHAYSFDVTGAGAACGAYYRPPAPADAPPPWPRQQQQQQPADAAGADADDEPPLPRAAEVARLDGNAAALEGRNEDAVEAFSRAVALAPWSPNLRAQLALALLRRRWDGDDAAALAECDATERLAERCIAAGGAGAGAARGAARQASVRRAQALRSLGQFACAAAACEAHAARWPRDCAKPAFVELRKSVEKALAERRGRVKQQRRQLAQLQADVSLLERLGGEGGSSDDDGGAGAHSGDAGASLPVAAAQQPSQQQQEQQQQGQQQQGQQQQQEGSNHSSDSGGGARSDSDSDADWSAEALLPWYGPERYAGGGGPASSDDEATSSGDDDDASSSDGEAAAAASAEAAPATRRRRRRRCAYRAAIMRALAADAPQPRAPAGPSGFAAATPGGRRLLRAYCGAANVQTDIKEAVFLGPDDALVACGSDCGRVIIFDADSGLPLRALDADDDVANCARAHPRAPVLATSGIARTIRLWAPTGAPFDDDDRLARLVADNQIAARRGGGFGVLRGLLPAALEQRPELLEHLLRGMGARVARSGRGPGGQIGGVFGVGGDEEGGESASDDDPDGPPQEVACRVA